MHAVARTGLCSIAIVLSFIVSGAGQARAQSFGSGTDCRLAGTWMADNGDQMTLGAIRNPSQGGSYSFRSGPNTPITMKIDGGYRVEGPMFRFRGLDQNQRQRDVSVEMTLDNPSAPTGLWLHYRNQVTGQGAQLFRLQQRGPC